MAIWAAAIGGAISLIGSMSSDSSQPKSNTPGYYDPYAQYRGAAALQLNNLMKDPSQVQNSPEYASMLDAAGRTSAAQGYNGSGNALVAAANAGGQAYQQEFNNLAVLSGAEQSPAQGAALASNQGNYNQQMNNQMWGGIGSMFGRSLSGGFGGGLSVDTSGINNGTPAGDMNSEW